jgi:hypothetical protein
VLPFSDPDVALEEWAVLHPEVAPRISQGQQGAPP